MAVATERVESAGGLKLATGAFLLGENSKPVVLNPNESDLIPIFQEMGLTVELREFTGIEKLFRLISNLRENPTSLIHRKH